jgi:hypothetical protein
LSYGSYFICEVTPGAHKVTSDYDNRIKLPILLIPQLLEQATHESRSIGIQAKAGEIKYIKLQVAPELTYTPGDLILVPEGKAVLEMKDTNLTE